jgi:hypothetical protein
LREIADLIDQTAGCSLAATAAARIEIVTDGMASEGGQGSAESG